MCRALRQAAVETGGELPSALWVHNVFGHMVDGELPYDSVCGVFNEVDAPWCLCVDARLTARR